MPIPTLSGVESKMIDTGRINVHVLETGPADGTPVLFIHGNVSSATFWEETMLALPEGYRGIAPDLRGYGETEALPVDATQGLGDMAEDVRALVETLGLEQHHIVGHSMGGGVVMKVAIAYPADLLSITLVDTMSPYGYGGSKGVDGELLHDDGAPSGVNPDFVRLLAEGERGDENPMAPRNVMRQFYFKPPSCPSGKKPCSAPCSPPAPATTGIRARWSTPTTGPASRPASAASCPRSAANTSTPATW